MSEQHTAPTSAELAEVMLRASQSTPRLGTTKYTPWQRIYRAGEAGRGVRLSADEVSELARDGAIRDRALLDNFETAE